ncbi:MAG: TIGR02172 family protein [Fibrobacter sp.]|nr:TIGR02172 family protein [Fibrobacter sp.]
MPYEFKPIRLEDWDLFGGGATAESFYHKTDPTLMLKLFNEGVERSSSEREYTASRSISDMGIRVPHALSLVQCGNRLGIIYERIVGKKSIARLCADDPENIPTYAKMLAREAKKLHATECDQNIFQPRKKILEKFLSEIHLSDFARERVIRVLSTMEPATTCIHGDLQMGNIIYADGRCYWIDLADFAYGSPLIDLGVLYFNCQIMNNSPIIHDLLHMTGPQLDAFWKEFLPEYLETDSKTKLAEFEKKVRPYAALFVVMAIHTLGETKLPPDLNDKIFTTIFRDFE